MKPIIIGAGPCECVLCPPNKNEKEGIALEVDGAEQQFCQKHFWSMLNLWRNAWAQQPKAEKPTPLLDRIENGR